jgi:hypothetical protein
MEIVGYALVSAVMQTVRRSCPECKNHLHGLCPAPAHPGYGGSPVCVPTRRLTPLDEEATDRMKEFRAQYAAYEQAHYGEKQIGTRLGPMHYFQDCGWIYGRSGCRPDSRVVALTGEMAEALQLPICKACAERMAPFESDAAEMAAVPAQSARAQSARAQSARAQSARAQSARAQSARAQSARAQSAR